MWWKHIGKGGREKGLGLGLGLLFRLTRGGLDRRSIYSRYLQYSIYTFVCRSVRV